MDDLDHAALRHRYGGKLGIDATEKGPLDDVVPALARGDPDDARRCRDAGDPALEGVRLLSLALGKVGHVLAAIKFEHTVFALPFAYIAMVLAAGGWPGWWPVLWITVAMAGARTCAMASNRVMDRLIDAANPRTAGRHLPRGLLQAWRAQGAGRGRRAAHARRRPPC